MNVPLIARATAADIPFLAEAVLGAERSGGKFSAMSRIFGTGEDELAELIASMFQEEIQGCEFSLASFLVAHDAGQPLAAVAGWTEGVHEDGMASAILRSNLIGFTFPQHALVTFRSNAEALAPLRIERKKRALQIEYVYVRPDMRGHGLASMLIRRHISEALQAVTPPKSAQVQVFANNDHAIKLYRSIGFSTILHARSDHPNANSILPHPEKLLMEKPLP